ncbi:MAG: hypothetical protein ACLVLI_04970, partial [Aedoeadaptatus pacaensis]
MKKIKLTALTGICLGLLLVATGCAKDTAQAEEANNQVEVVENQKTSEDLNKEAAENDGKEKNADDKNNSEAEDEKDGEEKSYNVTLTYPSTAYIVDGDEDNKKVTEQVTVTATKDDVITKVLDQLSQAPETEGAEPVGLDK